MLFLKSRLGFPGGLEKYTIRLAHHFAKRGCRTTVITTVDEKAPEVLSDKIEIIPLFKTKKMAFAQLLAFEKATYRYCLKEKWDLVFGMDRTSSQTHLRAGSGVHQAYLAKRSEIEPWYKKVGFSINPKDRITLEIEKRAFESRSLKKLFVNSTQVKHEILTYYQVDEKKIEVVANGVDWMKWQEPFEKRLIAKKNNGCIELLFVGSGFRRKNLATLLLALTDLKETPWHLSVVGGDSRLNDYKRLAQKLQLRHKVTFWGLQSDIISFYTRADILILPTLYDPFANAVLEALAMGLFVITTRENGASEFISERSSLLIDNPLKPHSIGQTLKKALSLFECNKKSEMALSFRNSIRHLDFSHQLDKIVAKTLDTL